MQNNQQRAKNVNGVGTKSTQDDYLGFFGNNATKQQIISKNKIKGNNTNHPDVRQPSQLNSATVMFAKESPPNSIQPGNVFQGMELPSDIQEKVARWRERQPQSHTVTQPLFQPQTPSQYQPHPQPLYQSQPQSQTQPQPLNQPQSQTQPQPLNQPQSQTQPQPLNQPLSQTQPQPLNQPLSQTQPQLHIQPQPQPQPLYQPQPQIQPQPQSQIQPQPQSQPQSQPPFRYGLRPLAQPLTQYKSSQSSQSVSKLQTQCQVQPSSPSFVVAQLSEAQLSGVPSPVTNPFDLNIEKAQESNNQLLLPTQPILNSQALFDTTTQDIMNQQIKFRVKYELDELKQQRPELVNQAEVMGLVTAKTQKFAESMQQMNVLNQRLRDMVESINVKLNAVQSNVEQVTHKSGGPILTEETMRSWTQFFVGEQLGFLKNDNHNDIESLNSKIAAFDCKIEAIDRKLQETLQNLYESTCFVIGCVLEDNVAIHEDSDCQSSKFCCVNRGDRLKLKYPVIHKGNDRWMKVQTVNPNTAEMGIGFVLVYFEFTSTSYVGNFTNV